MHVLFLLQTAVSLWMLVDIMRRRADRMWFFIVLMPFGEVAYFFAVVLPDLRRKGFFEGLFQRAPTVAELRRAYAETPSHENRLRLAQGLHDAGAVEEAGGLFEEVLAQHPEDRDALYGFAQCAIAVGEDDAAIDALEDLVALDIAYLEYAPAVDLVESYWHVGRQDEALELAEGLCRKSQRVGPRAVYATYLIELGRDEEARKLLRRGLETYASSPSFVRRRDRADAQAARALLRKL
ncbi:MAG TPA: tetratricopeptide repeat protein [Polyangiaceae bacterium LLY-WYZ-15_(1-7)]|nr:hypothetical protein [Myxococcales bacterium]MBJ73631.1 hypothetical protein [Sandaracinus sp.]HJK95485.1 tetratricopeptide repeat protein [Polyangiaceae bacterium LLY-WYZ-15_(1-7)]HJL02554.1 tetratricopeptide repeat protein [Polyangiaceae bacterium LLY-WYZ-15_(1-7)]HJL13134.1 tetratricopeptide repeat protein [Polyangiaceae bacterium LLY-WYZ-15_(1-7)]